jgi:dUTP pyrophosphatase
VIRKIAERILSLCLPRLVLKHDDVEIFYATLGAVGIDVSSTRRVVIEPKESKTIPTGVYIKDAYSALNGLLLPEIQIRPRSGNFKRGVFSPVGTVDMDYRGEMMAILYNTTEETVVIEAGERVAQLVPGIVLNLDGSVRRKYVSRGTGGFGSTGR